MKKIGFFGGTFDPIHFGHINLALSLLEKHQLEEVVASAGAGDPDAGAQYGEGRFGQLTDWIEWQSDHSSGGGCV